MRAHVIACLLLAVVPAPDCDAGGAATPFTSSRPGEVVVPVVIGGHGPFRFLLDTGSTHSAVAPALSTRLGARAIARASVRASAGTVECLVVQLPAVSVGPAAVPDLAATELPADGAAALGPDVLGILGQDFLARFSFTIDYRRSRIRWHEAGAGVSADGGVRFALVPSEDRFVIELPQRGHRRPLRVVPDSAADTLVLYDDPRIANLVDAWTPGRGALASPTGTRSVRVGIVEDLEVGGTTLERQQAVVLPGRPGPADAGGPVPDGLLPLHLFASVSFNAPERSLVIRPR